MNMNIIKNSGFYSKKMTFYFFVAGCALLLLNCESNTDPTGPGTNPNTETLPDTVIIDTSFSIDTLREDGIITSIANYRTIIKDSIHNGRRISDTNKVKYGLETKYNNGSISYTINYQNGQRHGVTTSYRADGTIDHTTHYQNGLRHGVTTKYRTDGTIDSLQCYQEGALQANRLLDSLLPTCRGFATGTGTDTIRDLNDSLYLIYDYQNGQRHGLYTSYRTDGTIDYTSNYQNGQLHGLYTYYNSNGSISSLYCYQSGQSNYGLLPTCRGFSTGTGTDTIRDLRDTIYLIYNYQNEQLHGLYTSYNSDGSISSLSCYQDGTRNISFCNGLVISRDTSFSIDILRYIRGADKIITNYRTIITGSVYNGQKISRTNRVRHGLETSYNSNGSIRGLSCYQNGVEQENRLLLPTCRGFTTGTGTDTIRDLRDTIYLIYGYKDGQRHGLYTNYRTNGSIDSLRVLPKRSTTSKSFTR